MNDLAVEPFVGFRIFRVDRRTTTLTSFTSLGKLTNWLPGAVAESSCTHAPLHGPMPPALNCTCGIWAVKSRRDLSRAYGQLAPRALSVDAERRRKYQKKNWDEPTALSMTMDEFLRQMAQMTQQRRQLPGLSALGSQGQPFRYVVQPQRQKPHPRQLVPIRDEHLGWLVSARVKLWGVVHEHERGYRAQYAQIIPETIRWWPRQGAWNRPKLLAHIIQKYSIAEGGEQLWDN